ncbi:MAG: hypothetical protein ABSB78_13360 [Bacteroidota bacterium]
MRIRLLSALILVVGVMYSQDTTSFYTQAKHINFGRLWILDSIDTEHGHRVKRPEPLGFIGDNYQRFRIHLISVIKNNDNPYEYMIYGKSKVKTNICEFQGRLVIKQVYIYKNPEVPEYKTGYLKGEYYFTENKKDRGTGYFKGIFTTYWYFDKNNLLKYDFLMSDADGFSNNEFVGTWTSYQDGQSKKCNWGDFRIPDSGDLDVGAGEFGVATKYENNGWKDYTSIWDAKSKELEWWK